MFLIFIAIFKCQRRVKDYNKEYHIFLALILSFPRLLTRKTGYLEMNLLVSV